MPLTKRTAGPGKWKERLNKITVSDYNTEVVTVSDEFTNNLRKTILYVLPTGRKLVGVFDKYSEL